MHHCDFAKKLSSDERKQIVARLRDNLDVDIEVGNPWDSVEAPDGVYRTDGWAVIPEYIGESSCLVFSPGAREIWNFSSGGALLDFLSNSPALEYYVCDLACSFLLCCNHHDYVIGWGKAQQWVANLS